MVLDLQALRDFPAHVELEVDGSGLDIMVTGVSRVGRVQMELDVVRSDRVYYCVGRVTGDVRLECSRCLESYPETLHGELDFSIQEIEESAGVEQEDVPDDEILIPAGMSRVDISEQVREALILEVPLKPLCKETCLGICPHCGVNRNEKQCECHVETTDPRWDGLRNLL